MQVDLFHPLDTHQRRAYAASMKRPEAAGKSGSRANGASVVFALKNWAQEKLF